MIICAVYCLVNTWDGRCYVGVTTDFKKRIKQHFRTAKYGRSSRHPLYVDMREHPGHFIASILEECSADYASEREKEWISELSSLAPHGYNQVLGGGLAREHSAESREKIRKAKTGIKLSGETRKKISSSNLGLPKSEETRKKISIAATGRRLTQSQLDGLAKGRTGRTLSEYTRKKLSENAKMRGVTEEAVNKGALTQMKGAVIHCSNGKVYSTTRDAAKDTGVQQPSICSVMSGRQKTTHGFSFKRVFTDVSF